MKTAGSIKKKQVRRIAASIISGLCLLYTAGVSHAAIGDTRQQTEDKLGTYSIVKDAGGQYWFKDQWAEQHAGLQAKQYGYITNFGELSGSVWIEYDQNRVKAEMYIPHEPIPLWKFKRYFAETCNQLADMDSLAVYNRLTPGSELGIVYQDTHRYILVRFYRLADIVPKGESAEFGVRSRIRAFKVTEISPQEYAAVRRASGRWPVEFAGGEWIRTDNLFRPELFFAERLIPRKKTDMIVVHHTAIENLSVMDIHELHLENGWAGVGYHYVILPDGIVKEARPEKMIGAHAYGANPRSIGIALVGNFDKYRPAPEQQRALIDLTKKLMKQYRIPLSNVVPHRSVSDTDCPGEYFPWEEFIASLAGDR